MRRQRPLESETRKENEPAGSKGAISSLAGLTRPSRRRFMTNEMAQCRADVRLGRHLAHLPDPPINNGTLRIHLEPDLIHGTVGQTSKERQTIRIKPRTWKRNQPTSKRYTTMEVIL
ncbi:hypothetical protein EN45_107490 [Penicillium chrysogenum]|uniref:Uncharacterized protein n=1 Tax=Penicillium chrysogenum TaxID=5076 RepID=A0A162BXX8_PENCH|nr:hypothetical protein NUH16_004850 [Penicillium rubens]KZN83643.1 hypothetical protein EN45_107490 [Penicillium chrysogenum]